MEEEFSIVESKKQNILKLQIKKVMNKSNK